MLSDMVFVAGGHQPYTPHHSTYKDAHPHPSASSPKIIIFHIDKMIIKTNPVGMYTYIVYLLSSE
jgi:hypothetical protein